MLKINTVTIIGANGTMGSSVAGIFASFGNVKVNLVSRTIEKSKEAVGHVVNVVRSDSIRNRLFAKTYVDLPNCISESDWIFESVSEDFNTKKDINDIIAKYRKSGTIVSTGTSGLSLEKLKLSFDIEGQSLYFGTHFFNPPYNLLLCEIITHETTDKLILNKLKLYLEQKLLRKTVILKDSPAFLANRVGFQFLNEVAQFAEIYKEYGGIDYIDAIIGPFTGRGLPPLTTIDFVGLDIHKAIVDNLYYNTNDCFHSSFRCPQYVEKLIINNKLGKKNGEGLYKTTQNEMGRKDVLVYDIEKDEYRKKNTYNFDFVNKIVSSFRNGNYNDFSNILLKDNSQEAKICKYFLFSYILYSQLITRELKINSNDVDTAMAYGFNWVPPFSLLKLLGNICINIHELSNDEVFSNIIKRFELTNNLTEDNKTIIDYRKFLIAKI